jgi:hypothetical protein
VWRRRELALWWRYGLFGVVLAGVFLLMLTGPIRAQQVNSLHDDWAWNNPRWQEPWTMPLDLVRHITEVFRYASEPAGNLFVIPAVVGGLLLWRQRQRRLLALLTWPLALNSVAWLMGHYPLGPSRVNAYLAPSLLLLVAIGARPIWRWLRSHSGVVGAAAAACLVLIPVGLAGYRLVRPWTRLDSREPAQYVLRHRLTDEPVVGTMWEHQYYFRNLHEAFRLFPSGKYEPQYARLTQSIAAAEGDAYAARVWLLVNSRDDDPHRLVAALEPQGAWTVREEHRFATVTALRLHRLTEALASRE